MLKYTTIQGDTWDLIALKVLGNERNMHLILANNPTYNDVVIFPANIVLEIPTVFVRNDNNLPTWRRSDS